MTACLTEYAEEGEVSEISEETDPGFERKRDALKKRLKAIETEFPGIRPRTESCYTFTDIQVYK